ncbi:hypothetical protein [Kitasatospora sp. NPDC058478]|uniref:hypothetical protein n=1 Tax=unclassified Kitasatospora TaxID=2633591 RepID=UPI003650E9C3
MRSRAIAALAAFGFALTAQIGTTAAASALPADEGQSRHSGSRAGEVGPFGLIPVNALNDVNVSPNLGCLGQNLGKNLTAQSLIGLVPVGVTAPELLADGLDLDLPSNGNGHKHITDNSCTAHQQAAGPAS